MNKWIVPGVVLFTTICLSGCFSAKKEEPYNRAQMDTYERNFSSNVFAACSREGTFYATYSLARLVSKPTEKNPCYKVTFVNGPCKGKTIYTNDIIEKTSPIDGGLLPKGEVVLRDFNNPRKLDKDTDKLGHWNKGIVYDTSRLDKGVVELEFPVDSNDFMATREFIFVQNIRYIQKPKVKDPRTWL